MKGLLNQRFNFFIVVIGFILAAIPYVKNSNQLLIVFIVGFFIELSFTLLIGRAYRRLKINIKLLKKIGDDPSIKIRKMADKGFILNPFKYSAVWIMRFLPIVITLLLLVSCFLTKGIFNLFK